MREAKRLVKDADLRTVASFYQKHARTKLKPITIPDLVKEMVTTLELDKRGDYHVRDLDVRLGRFAKDFPGQITDVSTEQIENWLRGLKSLAKGARHGGQLKGRSRNNYRNADRRIIQLRPEAWLPAERIVHRGHQHQPRPRR